MMQSPVLGLERAVDLRLRVARHPVAEEEEAKGCEPALLLACVRIPRPGVFHFPVGGGGVESDAVALEDPRRH